MPPAPYPVARPLPTDPGRPTLPQRVDAPPPRAPGRPPFTRLPRTVRGQFTLALAVLSLLILAGGVAAIYALRSTSDAAEQLALERLVRMQEAQGLVKRTMTIEHETERMLTTQALSTVRQSSAAIVLQTEELDREVAELTRATDPLAGLDLQQASQLFRNTAHVVAQLREGEIQAAGEFALLLQDRTDALYADRGGTLAALAPVLYALQDVDTTDAVERLRGEFVRRARTARTLPTVVRGDLAALRAAPRLGASPDGRDLFAARQRLINQREVLVRFHDRLKEQAQSMAAAARLQSADFDRDYRAAVQQLVDTSRQHQRRVLILLASSLLFAWLVAGVFLGRNVLRRLQQVSGHLLQRATPGATLDELAGEHDEIGEMARAVRGFLADQAQLESKTSELTLTQGHVVEQGLILEMIATSAPLERILDRLIRLIEAQLDTIRGSILLLDDDGVHLRHGAGPNLPPAFLAAIDGVAIGPTVGSCGAAAHRRAPVVVADIQADPLWSDYRALAALHDLRSCWSTPILSYEGAILGTFAMYSPQVRVPAADDLRLIELATRIAGIAIDRRRSELRIGHLAHYDQLTDLPNRTLLNDRLLQALAQARRTGRVVALLLLDLDGFKFINDRHGHPAGDAVLIAVATRLAAAVREGDTVARLGGDEFVVVLHDLERGEDAVVVARRILLALAVPIQIGAHSVQTSASIGISVHPGDGDSGDALLQHADVAMYRAKQQGTDGLRCYTEDMGLAARHHMELHAALLQALEEQQFELHYQPQVDLRSGRITAMEALIRWRHPDLGMVSPARFIPLAEETGLIVPIGEWVLRTACAQLQAWHAAGHADLVVAVNLSARQFQGHDVAQLVRRVLADCGLAGRFLELELTESVLMLDNAAVLQTLEQIKALGVKLALDDFGTGYSSLGQLRRFPIDVIKIDQSFTFDVTTSPEAASITRAIVAMAKSLGMKTIAEGVETGPQLRFMMAQQCESVQGYYFSRPLPAADMGRMLAQDPRLVIPGDDPQPAATDPSMQSIA